MKRIYGIALTFAALTALLPQSMAGEENERYMRNVQKAEEAIGKRNWPLGIAYLQEAMQSDPGNPQNIMLLSNMGMLHYYNGEDSLALRTLSEARAMAPASVVILSNRAQVLAGMGRTEDAVSDYTRIVEMDSTYADAYRERGALWLQMQQLTEAAADIDRYRRLRPEDEQGKLMQGVVLAASGEPEKAIPLYGELIEKKGDSVLFAARAMCYIQTDDLLSAAEDIASGLELDPNDGELYFCRALLNYRRFRDEDARADARRAMELGVRPERVTHMFKEPR